MLDILLRKVIKLYPYSLETLVSENCTDVYNARVFRNSRKKIRDHNKGNDGYYTACVR